MACWNECEATHVQDLAILEATKIERREWHLWYLALTLIVFLGGLTIVAYSVVGSENPEDRSTADLALWGVSILITLFCAYVVHTRIAMVGMRRLFERQAIRDHLTGLLNRQYFNDRVQEEIDRTARNGHILALLLCDLDHFKVVNDTHGHQAGDEILKAVAKSIENSIRGIDLAFRWGGDEIVVILSNTSRDGVLVAAERMRNGIRRISEVAPLDISIGAALYPEHGRHVDDLIRLADRALYIAKKGGDKIHIGEEEYQLNEQAVKIVFQPVVDTRSEQTLGFEALSRDPQGKVAILELFKRYQAVGQLNELKCLCFKLQLKKAQEFGITRVFMNVDFNMLGKIESVTKPDGMEVILEISEQEALHDIDKCLEIIRTWRAMGFKFAIDDFGSGFISLPFIARLIPDYIKLDRSTILQSVASLQFGQLMKDLIIAMRNYSKEGIIAEGIETEKELQMSQSLGTDIVQGFLLGKPEELTEARRINLLKHGLTK
jgi:diguanylate cyclase (GGDEF)-like protein